jgi:hypothetical protein
VITPYQHSLSSVGYVPDLAHGEVPPQAWTDGANMRFDLGAPRTIEGSIATHTVTTSVLSLFNTYTASSNFWVCAAEAAVYATDGSTVYDITRVSATTTAVPYGATAALNWTISAFGNFVTLCNGVNTPQYWDRNPANQCAEIPGWPATYTAAALRPYRNYLVAMDITIGSDRYPSLVMWSDDASYDIMPAEWAPTTSNDAGDNNRNDTPGWCIDGLTLGGSFIIYKEDAVWAMTWAGGSSIMSFRKLFDGIGILTRRCVVEFSGRHFFVGRGDVYAHDGVSIQSIAAGRVRKQLFDNINPDSYSRTFVVADHANHEIWVCYAEGAATNPNRALIYNYEINVWYPPRTLTGTSHIAAGVVDSSSAPVTFAASSGTTYDADTGVFDERLYDPSQLALLAARPAQNTLDKMNSGTTEGGASINFFLTRKLLPFVAKDATGGPALWGPQTKLIRRLFLDATGTGIVRVYIGVHAQESSDPTWFGPFRIDLAAQNFTWILVRGRYFSIKFDSDSDTGNWAMTGYKVDWEMEGDF